MFKQFHKKRVDTFTIRKAGTFVGLLEEGWQQIQRAGKELEERMGESEEKEKEGRIQNGGEEKEEGKEEEEEKEEKPKIRKFSQTKSKEQKDPLPLLNSKDFFRALTRWSMLKDSPEQVIEEVDSLLSLLSPSVVSSVGEYVAVDVSSFQKNRFCWEREGEIVVSYFNFFFFLICWVRNWYWNKDLDPEGTCKYILFRLAEPLLSSDTVATVLFLFFLFFFKLI